MTTFTEFDFFSFYYILRAFEPLYEDSTPYTDNKGICKIDLANMKKTRPRIITETM